MRHFPEAIQPEAHDDLEELQNSLVLKEDGDLAQYSSGVGLLYRGVAPFRP